MKCPASIPVNNSKCIRLRLWRSLPFYYLATANLVNDLAMTLVHGVYMTPSILAESYIFPNGVENPVINVFSFIYITTWYTGASLDIMIAFDRLFMIKKWKVAFSSGKSAFYAAICPCIVSTIVNLIARFASPCCRFLLMWEYFGYAFYNPKNETNWTDLAIDLPLNNLTSTISFVCYAWIGIHIMKEKDRHQSQSSVRQRDYTLAVNYGIISLLFTTAWVTLRVFAWIYDFKYLWMMSVTPFLAMLKCSANAVIFLKNNREIRRDIGKMFRCGRTTPGNTTVSSLVPRVTSNETRTVTR